MKAEADDHRAATDVDRRLAARVKKRRLEAGLSQVQLAGRLGVTFQQVQKYESGRNRISAGRLLAICRALEISPIEILSNLDGRAAKPAKSNYPAEMQRVVEAFVSIEDPATRQKVLVLLQTLNVKRRKSAKPGANSRKR
jgi:transcriptional regulator with XRE-family HTH domain